MMDIGLILSGIVSFSKLLLLVSIVSFIGYKLFAPVREKIAEKYSLSWMKSCFVFNFLFSFIILLLIYVYFMIIGASIAPVRDPEIEYDLFENILLILIACVRVFVISVILALTLLFFELVASLFMTVKETRKSKKKSSWIKQFIGVLIASIVFLFLLLFLFSWVPLGLFVFLFYGSLQALPMLILV